MLQSQDFRNSIQETELIEMQKVRVRRDHPNGITWAFALMVTMLFVYLATLAIPEKDAEPVGAQITRAIQLEPVSAAFVSLGAYPDALNARVAAAEFMQRGAAGFVLMHEGKYHMSSARRTRISHPQSFRRMRFPRVKNCPQPHSRLAKTARKSA